MGSLIASPILYAWEQTLADNSDRPALLSHTGETILTFAGIERRAKELALQLPEVKTPFVAGFCAENHPDWIPVFLTLVRAGFSVVLLESQAPARPVFRDFLAACGIQALVTLSPEGLAFQNTGIPISDWRQIPAIVKATSGTTGVPRAIAFTANQILADCDNVCDSMGITKADLNYGAISMAHSYGFSNLVTPLLSRGVPLVVTSDRMPRSILNGLEISGATLFPGAPIFFQKMNDLAPEKAPGNLRLVISAGAPLAPGVAAEFRRWSGQKIHTFYGSSECGGICYDAETATDFAPGFVGTPMRNVNVSLDECSLIVQSAAVALGYHPKSDPALDRGVFRPSDVLKATTEGFYISGRVSDLINVAGRKLNPAEVERTLLEVPGVRQAVVFGIANDSRGEAPAACVVGTAPEKEILDHCRSQLPAWQIPRFVRVVDEIPANPQGKISRTDLARRFAGS